MKKFFGVLLALVLAFSCVTLVACVDKKEETPSEDVAVAVVTLNKDKAVLEAGGTLELTATVSPDNATDKTVTWSTSAEAVATVENGKVTAVSAGTATITAKAGEQSAVCTITVSEKSGGNDNTGDTDKDNTQTEEPETSGGCSSSAGVAVLAVSVLLCAGAAVVLFRKRA